MLVLGWLGMQATVWEAHVVVFLTTVFVIPAEEALTAISTSLTHSSGFPTKSSELGWVRVGGRKFYVKHVTPFVWKPSQNNNARHVISFSPF